MFLFSPQAYHIGDPLKKMKEGTPLYLASEPAGWHNGGVSEDP